MPGLAWENHAEHAPSIHPDDLPLAKRIRTALGGGVRLTDTMRLRSTDGDWMPVRIEANLMLLDERTTAAYVVASHAFSNPGV